MKRGHLATIPIPNKPHNKRRPTLTLVLFKRERFEGLEPHFEEGTEFAALGDLGVRGEKI